MLRNCYILFLCVLALCAVLPLHAQNCDEATATEILNANKIEVAIRNGGDFFTDGQSPYFFTPHKNDATVKQTGIYAAGLWMGGYDAVGNLHVAAQTYRQAGHDYWAGPISRATASIDSITSKRFDYVWKVSLLDILNLIQDYQVDQTIDHPIASTLLVWPGRGNPYYTNHLGYSLPDQDLAPFFDQNNDGIYDPYQGDYPVFEHGNPNALADELAWCVFNDLGNQHEVTDSLALGIEVQLTAYAFNCGAAVLQDAIFTKHRIINRSGQDYYNFRAALHIDFDLGCASDDYIGTDTSLQTIYVYNADYHDGGASCMDASFGAQPPVISATYLNQEIKKSIFNLAADFSLMGAPDNDNVPAEDYYNLMEGKWVGGLPLTYGGSGYDSLSADTTNYVFPHYPFDTTANKWWADAGFNWAQGQDFRSISSIWGNTLLAGESRDIDMVYVYHYDDNLTGLYNMLKLIPQRIPQIKQLYNNGFAQAHCQSFTDFKADLKGRLYWDKNKNCSYDEPDELMSNVVIEVKNTANDSILYVTTDSTGHYALSNLAFGHYELGVIPPSPYWKIGCQASGVYDLLLTHPNQVDSIDIPISDTVSCSFLEIDVATPILTHCANNRYTVSYCNHGTDTAFNAIVRLQIDSDLTVGTTSLPLSSQQGQEYSFAVGDIAPHACGMFNVEAFLACDSLIVGQTHCVEASIKPDSLCIDYWNGPIFDVEAICQGDSIQFLIRNIGTITQTPIGATLIVIEDMIMRPPLEIEITGSTPSTISIPVTDGVTYRAEVQQQTGASSLVSDPFASAVVEGCGIDSLGQIHLGYVNMFSNGYTNPFKAIDCQESIATSDTYQQRIGLFAKKQAFPSGYGNQHYIYPNTAIDYHIRVQNTNLNSVIIRDTLSPYLDPTTFEAGASSHPYSWRIYDKGIIEFRLDSIKTNTAILDDVYIKYRLNQKPMNPLGTVIESKTAIEVNGYAYRLNPVFHHVANDFVTMLTYNSISNVETQGIEFNIYPHPVENKSIMTINGVDEDDLIFELYTPLGQLIRQVEHKKDAAWVFERNDLVAGLYFFKITKGRRIINAGQMVLK